MDWKEKILRDACELFDGYLYRDLKEKSLEYLDDVMETTLNDRERDTLRMRYKDNASYVAIGEKYHVSGPRILDICRKAQRKIRLELKVRMLSAGARNQEEAIQYLQSLPYEEKIKKSILALRLHQRTSNTLIGKQVKTIGQLAALYETSAPYIPGLGVETINKIRKLLSECGALNRTTALANTGPDTNMPLELTDIFPHCIDLLHAQKIYTLQDIKNSFRTKSDLIRAEGIGQKAANTILAQLNDVGLEIPDYTDPCDKPVLSSPESITLMHSILESIQDKASDQNITSAPSSRFYRTGTRIFCRKKVNIMAMLDLLEQCGGHVSLGFYEKTRQYEEPVIWWYIELV